MLYVFVQYNIIMMVIKQYINHLSKQILECNIVLMTRVSNKRLIIGRFNFKNCIGEQKWKK